ncbi:MAG: rhodanese-like domain-containing protein [Nitrospira sp.]|nr:rhodanese-like domain-containing protein [Nitrospira sp.]
MNKTVLLPVMLALPLTLSLPLPILAQSAPPAVMQKVEASQKHVRTIGMDEYRKLVENPGAALIVDVREPQEFSAGHVPGAINIPRGRIESQIWDYVGSSDQADKERPIILQCQSGKRATLASQTLQELGFTQTTVVLMNLNDWQKVGNPFVK